MALARGRLSGTGLLLFAAVALGAPALAEPVGVETAALVPGNLTQFGEAALPRPLSDDDAERYRRIFRLQEKARWTEADREIARLKDPMLLGHLLAQRYLSPNGYPAKFAELSRWLDRYADLPEATQVYGLALKRKARGAPSPRHPEGMVYNLTAAHDGASEPREARGALSRGEMRRLAELRRAVRRAIDEDRYGEAERRLESGEAKRLLASGEYEELRSEIAGGFYFLSQDKAAVAFADAGTAADKHVNAAVERAGGLAAWRLGNFDEATRHFERLAAADTADSWTRAAGAYWAARCHLVNGEPEKVTHWLDAAAGHPYTFYGILARRLAGRASAYNWQQPAFTGGDAAGIMSVPAGVRALALVQVGEDARAEQELRRVNPARPGMARALLAVSQRADMPSLGMQVAAQIFDADGQRYDAALYPMPSWAPRGGFNVDPALVFALIRQESKFLRRAESPVGARGLMQLMPRTARFISDGTPYGGRRNQLFDPEINLTLGQNYLAHLMSIGNVGENLFLITAAYNGGPGNVARWQREIRDENDPLLFLESIPKRETRQFVERVLANYWIYLDQLGQPSTALDAIAEGRWPTYKSMGN